jgi:hypothetical protein
MSKTAKIGQKRLFISKSIMTVQETRTVDFEDEA